MGSETGGNLGDNEAAGLLMLFSNQPNSNEATEAGSSSQQQEAKPVMAVKSSSEHARMKLKSPTEQQLNLSHITKSPGLAAVALASGNSSNKAMVAAAALAAAAATPIPIMHHRSRSISEQPDKILPEITKIRPKSKSIALPAVGNEMVPLKQETMFAKPSKSDTTTTEGSAAPAIANEDVDAPDKPPVKEVETVETETELEEQEPPKVSRSKRKKSRQVTPSYAVDPDAGIIGCICDLDHDDGFTIQCDKCFRWQHAACMNIDNIDDAPDNYLCYLCDPSTEINAERARKLQESKLQPKRRKSPYAPDNSKENRISDPKTGAAQFKKRKTADSTIDNIGPDKFQTLYYPIDHIIFKSSTAKSLYSQLPELLKKDKEVLKLDKAQLKKSLIDQNQLNVKSAYDNPKSKFSGISKVGLYTLQNIKSDSLITLFNGEIDIKENYINEKGNQYWLLGCSKPCVFFHPNLPIIIDERGLGNHTRFIRKSCSPNCEIKTVVINKQESAFILSSTKEIYYDEELTLPWSWDENHMIMKILNNDLNYDDLDNELKLSLFNSLHNILDFTECACSNNSSDCIINKIKKQMPQFRNSKRYQYSYDPTPKQQHKSIITRFKERDREIVKESLGTIVEQNDSDENINNNNTDNKNEEFSEIKPLDIIISMDEELPSKLKLIREYQNEKDVKDRDNNENEKDTSSPKALYTPVGISSRLMSKLSSPSTSTENTKELSNEGNEEKPKIKKKFSLADYKKKKTS